MLTPQKFSKTLGENKLKVGLSLNELGIISFAPFVFNLFGVSPFISLVSFLVLAGLLAVKNRFLAPHYIENAFNKKPHLKWERIDINAKDNNKQ